jgi:hypothetical protein
MYPSQYPVSWVKCLQSVSTRFQWSLCSSFVIKGISVSLKIVDGKKTVIYPRGLSATHTSIFKEITEFSDLHGFTLLENRRINDVAVTNNRRCTWASVIALSLGLSTVVFADETLNQALQLKPKSNITLYLFDERLKSQPKSDGNLAPTNRSYKKPKGIEFNAKLETNHYAQAKIQKLLTKHYIPSKNDPEHVQKDLTRMAEYFSRYPTAIELITSLEKRNWTLHYKKDTYRSDVSGSRMSVDSVKVFFDTRSAAQLKFNRACNEKKPMCIASPADSLLHELLHTQSALLKTGEFIAQGGLNGVIYPYHHERIIIKSENKIYQTMKDLDGNHRPIRRQHIGKAVSVACVTCLQ